MDRANMKNAFTMSAGAGNDDGHPLLLSQQELFDKDGATSNAPFVESNIVGACERQRSTLLYNTSRSCNVHGLQTLCRPFKKNIYFNLI